jgi:exosortase
VRTLFFFLTWAFSVILFREPLSNLLSLSFHDERYSYIALIPFVSLFLVYLDRKQKFLQPQYWPSAGLPLVLMGTAVYYIVNERTSFLSQGDHLSLSTFAIVLVWIGGFALCYGPRTFSASVFPLSLLLLTIPLPTGTLQAAVIFLQKGSTEMADELFKLIGLPAFRQGFTFSLPGVDIKIAEECSGIRSSIALLLASLLAGHIFLQSGWRRVALVLFTIPLVIFKNAVRIVTIAWLAIYVNRGFFSGKLHHQGGLAFTVPDFAILVAFLLVLRQSETRSKREHAKTTPPSLEDAVKTA